MELGKNRSGAFRSAAARELAREPRGDGRERRGPRSNFASSLDRISRQLDTPEGYIRLSGPLEHDNIVNGDGLRAVLWTQGCPNHCPGCQNPETWDYDFF